MNSFNADEFNAKFLAIFSVLVVTGALAFIAVAMFSGVAKPDNQVAMLVVGSLLNIVALVVGYWFGSSAGSKRNADRIAAIAGPPVEAPARAQS